MKGSLSLGGLGMMRMTPSDGARLLECFPLFQVFLIPARVSYKTRIAGPCKGLRRSSEF